MSVPRPNDVPVVVVVGGIGKRKEDRNSKKTWVRVAETRNYDDSCVVECQHLPLKTNRTTARRWQKCSLGPSDDVPSRGWGRSRVYGNEKPPE